MKIALGLVNPTIGDVPGNLAKIRLQAEEAARQGAVIAVFPEMSLIGYPPRDLVTWPALKAAQTKALVALKKISRRLTLVVGGFAPNRGKGRPLQNVAFVVQNGRIQTYAKQLLPNYDVFDEARHYHPGDKLLLFRCGGNKIGVTICEDIWAADPLLKRRYRQDPVKAYAQVRPDILINISASPFEMGKFRRRMRLLQAVAKRVRTTLIYVNQVGANDDLIFDGGASVIDKRGQLLFTAPRFQEGIFIHELSDATRRCFPDPIESPAAELRRALVLGLRDYVTKTGHRQIVLGLSGGIDSSLVAALACDALGPENVLGVMMPSRYSSSGSVSDATQLAHKMGFATREVAIEALYKTCEATLTGAFAGALTKDLTDQNLQARLRGLLLMAISNNENRLLLNTTNKSEMAMGYGTLYGDLCGALAVIGDLTKNQVYSVAREYNRNGEMIPQAILDKEPSAELKPHQRDTDSLPPYDILDPLVTAMIVEARVPPLAHLDPLRRRVLTQILQSEYKRRQAPLCLKVSGRAFGPGRKFPVVAKI